MSLIVMDFNFNRLGEVAQYQSLRLTRSYGGVGAAEITVDARAPGALALMPECVVFRSEKPEQAYVIEDATLQRGRLTAKGTMLKGLCKRRVCVPPLSLPTRLWRYAGGAWQEITDAAAIRAALTDESVYQGFVKPESPAEGQLFLDMAELGAVYDWGTGLGLGEVASDLSAAQLRSKYQNFGWDRFTGDAESALLHFAAGNLTAPEDASRVMPGITLAENQHRGDALPWQARFDKLDAMLESITDATGIGWDIVPDFENRRFVLGARQGRDLSQGDTLCVISEKMGNAAEMTFKRTLSGSATTCYVGGAGEDENRFILSVGGEQSGFERRELWAEAGSVSEPDLLRLYGGGKLENAAEVRTLTAELIDSGACRYGREYDVGDIVISRDSYGNQQAARVSSVTETYESGRRTLSAVLGDAPVTLGKVLTRTSAAAR